MSGIYIVAAAEALEGPLDEEEWDPAPPSLHFSIEEASEAARAAAEQVPGQIYTVAQIGPVLGSWRAEPTKARPTGETRTRRRKPKAGTLHLVHSRGNG